MNDRNSLWSRRIGGGVAAVLGLCMASGCITTGATQSRILAPRATQMGSFVPSPYIGPAQEARPVQASQLATLWGPTPIQESATPKPIAETRYEDNVDLTKTPATLGAVLKMDPQTEKFIDNAQADQLLTREYREPFVVPKKA